MSEPAQPVTLAPVLIEVVNGTINLRKTHPCLWGSIMVFAAINVALGLNFIFLHPTFAIFHKSNYLWGAIFLGLGLAKIVFANLYLNLRLVRAVMAIEVFYMLLIAWGATAPFIDGVGSLQNPILYLGLCTLEIPLMREPFINQLTARRN